MSSSLVATKPIHTIEDNQRPGVILIKVAGLFDLPTLRHHFAENAVAVQRWRSADRPIRVLIDAVDLKPHSPEGQACVQEATGRIYRPDARVAILVSSSLVKMQMRRALSRGEILNFFISENAALTWLDVRQQPRRQYEAVSQQKR